MKKQQSIQISGVKGNLTIDPSDEVALKLAMLFEGLQRDCPLGQITIKYGYRREHFYHLLDQFKQNGSDGLRSGKTGPKTKTVRNTRVVNQIIRHRFLDPDASAPVIAQKLKQEGIPVTIRSVERTITEYGLQKKTLINLTQKKKKQLLKLKLLSE